MPKTKKASAGSIAGMLSAATGLSGGSAPKVKAKAKGGKVKAKGGVSGGGYCFPWADDCCVPVGCYGPSLSSSWGVQTSSSCSPLFGFSSGGGVKKSETPFRKVPAGCKVRIKIGASKAMDFDPTKHAGRVFAEDGSLKKNIVWILVKDSE